jgi:hypothetical protein
VIWMGTFVAESRTEVRIRPQGKLIQAIGPAGLDSFAKRLPLR